MILINIQQEIIEMLIYSLVSTILMIIGLFWLIWFHQYCLETVGVAEIQKYSKLVVLSLQKNPCRLLVLTSCNIVEQNLIFSKLSQQYVWSNKKKYQALVSQKEMGDTAIAEIDPKTHFDFVVCVPQLNKLPQLKQTCLSLVEHSPFLCILIPKIYGWSFFDDKGIRLLEKKDIHDPIFQIPLFDLYFCQIKK